MNLPSDYYVFLKNEIENTIKEVMEYSEAEYDFIECYLLEMTRYFESTEPEKDLTSELGRATCLVSPFYFSPLIKMVSKFIRLFLQTKN